MTITKPAPTARGGRAAETLLHNPALGPLGALLVAVIVFALTTSTFLTVDNLSLVVQQSLVIATLALGQTLIVLTGGIDLANAAIMVLGTMLFARLVTEGTTPLLALLVGFAGLCPTRRGLRRSGDVAQPATVHRHARHADRRTSARPAVFAGKLLAGDRQLPRRTRGGRLPVRPDQGHARDDAWSW